MEQERLTKNKKEIPEYAVQVFRGVILGSDRGSSLLEESE